MIRHLPTNGFTSVTEARTLQAAKDWGWREFVTLTSLFDLDAGFLVNDAVVFSAEVSSVAHSAPRMASCTL